MPIGKRTGTDGTLYALIAFVFLFIVATSAAIFCYLKYEEQRTAAEAAQRHLDEVANPTEVSKIGSLVGTEQQRKEKQYHPG